MLSNFLLRLEGIEIISELPLEEKQILIDKINNLLVLLVKQYGIEKEDFLSILNSVKLYYASFKEEHVFAKYHKNNGSIYLNQKIDIYNPNSAVVHEFIHLIQTRKNILNNSTLGLYKSKLFFNEKNLALNEGAVQYLASQSINEKIDELTYFNLNFNSPSQNFYPIETTIIKQMIFFTGSFPLLCSTIYSNQIFENTFSEITSKKTFDYISKNLDELLRMQDEFSKLYFEKNISQLSKYKEIRYNLLNENIKNTVLNIQDVIFQNAFNNLLNKIEYKADIENFKTNLNNFENVLIKSENNSSFYKYKDFITLILNEKEEIINKYGKISLTYYLIPKKENFFIKNFKFLNNFINKIKLLYELHLKPRLNNE